MDEPICSICRQVIAHPELRGKMFRRKGKPEFAMQFSQTLIQMAGGMDRLLAEWEEDDYPTPRQLRDAANGPWEE